MMTVTITDENLEPIVLDNFRVIDIETREDLTLPDDLYSLEFAQESGEYPIISNGVIDFNETI